MRLNAVDVFFVVDKGAEKEELLNRLRQEICETYIKDPFLPDRRSRRTRSAIERPASYEETVKDWHQRRAVLFETMIRRELGRTNAAPFSSGAILAL